MVHEHKIKLPLYLRCFILFAFCVNPNGGVPDTLSAGWLEPSGGVKKKKDLAGRSLLEFKFSLLGVDDYCFKMAAFHWIKENGLK